MRSTLILPFALLPLALAKDIAVQVGNKGNNFDPTSVTGSKGDTVTFSFIGGDHSVAQSSFDKPCHPIANAIYSGFIPGGSPPKTFNITIQDDKPVWIYCSQGNHCYGDAMVLSINAPTSGNTYEKFAANAIKETSQESPPKVSSGSSSGGSNSSSSGSGSSSTSSGSATGSATGTSTGTASDTGAATGTGSSATPTKSSAAGNLNVGAGMGAMGLLGLLAGGMI